MYDPLSNHPKKIHNNRGRENPHPVEQRNEMKKKIEILYRILDSPREKKGEGENHHN